MVTATKSRLERQFDREEARAARDAAAFRKQEEKQKEREEKARTKQELKILRELMSVFRRSHPVKIGKDVGYPVRATFTFRSVVYHVQYSRWTIGEEGIDTWETKHEGWQLYVASAREGYTLFEADANTKMPTPETFHSLLVTKLRDILRDRG